MKASGGPTTTAGLDLRLAPAAGTAWGGAAWACGQSAGVAAAAGAGVAGAALAVAVVGMRAGHRRSRDGVGGGVAGVLIALSVAVLVLAATAGHVAVRSAGPLMSLAAEGRTATVDLLVRREARPVRSGRQGAPPRVAVLARAERVEARGISGAARTPVLVLAGSAWREVPPGARVRATGRLVATPAGDDVGALLVVRGAAVPLARAGPVHRVTADLRDGLRQAVRGLPPDSRGLLPGLVLGDTSALPGDLEEAMRVAGLTHLTAVSGSNVAIVCGAALLAAAWCGAGRRLRLVAAAAALAGFVVLVGPDPSVLRAGVMGAVGLLGLAAGRRGRGAPALCGAVVVLVCVDPWLSRSAGFALSVLATGGLLVLARPWGEVLSRVLPRPVALAVALPAAAQAVCQPVVVLLDPALSTWAVPANVAVAALIAPATVLGVLATLLAVVWPGGAAGVAAVAGLATTVVAEVARTAAGAPAASLPWREGWSGAALLAGATVVGAWTLAVLLRRRDRAAELAGAPTPEPGGAPARPRRPRRRRAGAAAGALALGLVLWLGLVPPPGWTGQLIRPGWPPPGWRVVACDVGQGDALVVSTGPARALLIDSGQEPDVVDACLRRLGVRHLDALVLTHFHADHVGGVSGALRGRTAGEVLVSPLAVPEAAAAAVAEDAAAAGVRWVPVRPGLRGTAGEVSWEVVWPARLPPPGTDASSAANDASVVLDVRAPGLRLLALGDVEPPAQQALRRRLAAGAASGSDPAVDVVKVAHHGSAAQDPALYALLRPRVALVSAGKDNDYGHPAPATLRLLGHLGAEVLRTDTGGDLALASRTSAAAADDGLDTVPARGGPLHVWTRASGRRSGGRRKADGRRAGGAGRVRRAAAPPVGAAWQAAAVASPRKSASGGRGPRDVDPAPLVLVTGTEALLADRAVETVLAKVRAASRRSGEPDGAADSEEPGTRTDVEVVEIEASTYEAGYLAMVTSPSLFGGSKVVLARGVEAASDAFVTDATAYVQGLAEDAVLVLRHAGGNRAKPLLDLVRASTAQVVDCKPLKYDNEKVEFVHGEMARVSRRVTPGAVRALVDALGNDLRELAGACTQLLDDTEGTIDEEVVARYHGGRVEATGFAVADEALAGRTGPALALVRHALATGADPVPLVAALAIKLRVLAKVHAVGRRGRSADVARELGVTPWQVDNARSALGGWTPDGIAAAITAVAEADGQVKGAGRDRVYAVERAVMLVAQARG